MLQSSRIMSIEATSLSPEYVSRIDKIEIHKWLDGELGDDLPSMSGLRRLRAIGQEIEQRRKDAYEKSRNIFAQ
jgi:hypothetical protein